MHYHAMSLEFVASEVGVGIATIWRFVNVDKPIRTASFDLIVQWMEAEGYIDWRLATPVASAI
jgi:DNA-binding LacI/PurR family transcriptional regulator